MGWISIEDRSPSHGDIVNLACTRNGIKFVTLCQISKHPKNGKIRMDGVEFSGHDLEYDFDWHHVEYWQLAPVHPDL